MPRHCMHFWELFLRGVGGGDWEHASIVKVHFRATQVGQVGPEAISKPFEMPSVLNRE